MRGSPSWPTAQPKGRIRFRRLLRPDETKHLRTGRAIPSTRCRAVRLDMRGVDHLRGCRSPVSDKFPEQIFPDPAPRPAHEAVIDRRRWAIGRRAIASATAAFQHLHDAADDAAVVHPLNPPDIRGQERRDPLPLLVAQPTQIPAHKFKSFQPKNHYLIVSAEGLMSSHPNSFQMMSLIHTLHANAAINDVDLGDRAWRLSDPPIC
jgi:hypothetical protein